MSSLAAYGGYCAAGIALVFAALLSRRSSILGARYSRALLYFRLFMLLQGIGQFLVFQGGISASMVYFDYAWLVSWAGYVIFLRGLHIAVGHKAWPLGMVLLWASVPALAVSIYTGLPGQLDIHVMDGLYLVLLGLIIRTLNRESLRERRATRLLQLAGFVLLLPVATRSGLVLFFPDMADVNLAIWLILNMCLALALSAIVLLLLNWQLMSVLRNDSLTDALTGLQNRRSLEAWYPQMQSLSVRSDGQTGFLVCDLDYFKQVNDNYGHDCGDAVLREFAEILQKSTRASDFVARIGGEEFVVVMPMADKDAVDVLSERIRSLTAAVPFRIDELELPITTSIGAGLFPGNTDLARAFEEADASLYIAKQEGRNRVVFRPPSVTSDSRSDDISPAWSG